MYYDYDNDYMDDEFDDDWDEIDVCEDLDLDDPKEQTDTDEIHEGVISFEDFLFWGGFLGINIDEERLKRHRKKKKKEISDLEDDSKKGDDF